MSADKQKLFEQLTVDVYPDAARMLGIGRGTAYAMARTGQLPTIKIGKRLKVPTASLRKLLGVTDAAAA